MAETTKLIRMKEECSSRVYKAWTEPLGVRTSLVITSKKAAESERIKFGQHRQSTHRRLYEESGRVSADRLREWGYPGGILGRPQGKDHRRRV